MSDTKDAFLHSIIPALLIAAGITGAGYFVGNMIYKSRASMNTALVKGLAERQVKANVGAWSIPYASSNDKLDLAYKTASDSKEKILAFLKTQGFTEQEIVANPISVTKNANSQMNRDMFEINGSVAVHSEQVDKIAAAAQHVGDLVGQGVMLAKDSDSYRAAVPTYQFTKLNDIKPEMLGEATRNARIAAEQFAKDANAKVGGISAAEQGAFNIVAAGDTGAEQYGSGSAESVSLNKTVRVVTTISFYLENQ